jgi:1-acyl-sn-glycerol-3-phosphate acyltransferase
MYWQNRSWLFRLTWPITHYLITHIFVLIGYLFFHVFNRTIIIGKKNVPQEPNTLLLSNHQTMIDSFLVGICAFFPKSLARPSVMPWNPAAEENFFRNPILAWLADNWKCLPIKKGRKDVGAIFKMSRALRQAPMTFFPEGTRTRNGKIGRARGGAGLLILENRPAVIPVCIEGMDKVLPIGSIVPKMFKKIYVYYGPPMDLAEFYSQEKTKEVAQEVMTRVMDKIRQLHTEIQMMKSPQKSYQSQAALQRESL